MVIISFFPKSFPSWLLYVPLWQRERRGVWLEGIFPQCWHVHQWKITAPWFFSGNGMVSRSLLSRFRISLTSLWKKKTQKDCLINELIHLRRKCQSAYLSIFSMSVTTSHCSCRNSMGEEDCSSRIGTSELSSILKSTFGSESVPWQSNRNISK